MRLAASSVGLARRRPDEGKVDVDGLLEQLGLVRAVDGGPRLLKGGVLDQRVALYLGLSC